MKINWLFALCLLVGISAVLYLLPLAENYTYANGKELLAFYIPLPVSLLFLVLSFLFFKEGKHTLQLGMLLMVCLLIPFYSVCWNDFIQEPRDDGYRYSMLAKNIVQQPTLWGSDDLVYNTSNRVYMFQPGYRYYLAAWIAITGGEKRIMQLFNLLIYFSAITWLLHSLRKKGWLPFAEKAVLIFIWLSSAFVVKNSMLGLTEWITILLFVLMATCYINNHQKTTVLLLALLPFFRQNLLIVSLVIFIWLLFQWKKYYTLAGIYLLILLLPVYHNLYYAGRWKFFATYYNTGGFLTLYFEGSTAERVIKTVLYKLSCYSGYNFMLKNFWANALAMACIPFGSFLLIRAGISLHKKQRRAYWIVALAAILPTLLLGGQSYYPRFEWTALMIGLLFFLMIKNSGNRIAQPY